MRVSAQTLAVRSHLGELVDDDASLPRPRRILGVLSPDQERTIRFLLGVGVLFRELLLVTGAPRVAVLFVGGILAGTPFTNIADEIRRSLTGGKDDR